MFNHLIWLKSVDSTQEVLKGGSFPHGTVVVADTQKRGKGRKGRRWESQEGGLYLSFVLYEEYFREFLQIPLVVGLALSEFVESFGLRASIKWPNDLYLNGRKLAGTLVEKSGSNIFVGVGLNLNQEDFPSDIRVQAISLKMLLRKKINRVEALVRILDVLSSGLEFYSKYGFAPLKDKIEEKLLFKNEEVVVISENPEVGVLLGIDEDGYLLLETGNSVKRVFAGDVSLRPHSSL